MRSPKQMPNWSIYFVVALCSTSMPAPLSAGQGIGLTKQLEIDFLEYTIDHHSSLERYCRDILNSQLPDIDEMRHLLCMHFHICDYQPLSGPKGNYTALPDSVSVGPLSELHSGALY